MGRPEGSTPWPMAGARSEEGPRPPAPGPSGPTAIRPSATGPSIPSQNIATNDRGGLRVNDSLQSAKPWAGDSVEGGGGPPAARQGGSVIGPPKANKAGAAGYDGRR